MEGVWPNPAGRQPRLRLVLADDAPAAPASTGAAARARQDVARENLSATTLAADDARLAFALKVADTLEGGQAAILSPDRRRELIAGAVRDGLRPFDANLIIAIVQDAARRREAPTAPAAVSTLSLLAPAAAPARVWPLLAIAALLGAAAAGSLIWWTLQ